MFQKLSGEGNFSQSAEGLAALHCLIISVVLKTMQNGPSIGKQTGDLDHLADILHDRFPALSSLIFPMPCGFSRPLDTHLVLQEKG